jgi:glycine/D-amino acid oxidase-like deaminating enzyme
MAPRVDPVVPSPALPAQADVVVIGGGIVGASTALFLARKGIAVALCEKGEIGAEQSGRNWGWCRVQGRDPREIPLALESLRIWRDPEQGIGPAGGFRACGILYLAETPSALESYAAWLEQARAWPLDGRLLSPVDVQQVVPGLTAKVEGALFTPSDGRAEPGQAAPAIARAVLERGGAVLTNCAVRTVETTAGRVSGVVTERGPIACGGVVLAGGAWSRLFCGNLGIELPQLKVLGSVLRTDPVEGGPEASSMSNDWAFRRNDEGGCIVARGTLSVAELTPDSFRLFRSYLPALRRQWRELRPRLGRQFMRELLTPRHWKAEAVTAFERQRVLDPAPSHGVLEHALKALRRAHPAFATLREAERWAGQIDVTPDAIPVMSGVDSLPGLFLATGFSGHGFGIGPGAGRLMADLVTGATPVVDPSAFRLSRFADGSPIVLGGL